MTSTDQGFENIIKKNFTNEIQQKRVKKELQSLKELNQTSFKITLQSSPLGLKIIVELTKEFIERDIKETKNFVYPIIFEFLLEPKFPFIFPKLFCKTSFYNPTLADGRDFTNDVVGKLWTPAILLKDVVIMIPNFLRKINKYPQPEQSQLLGQYHLGHAYNLEDFLTMDYVAVFPASEIVQGTHNPERYIMIAESFFLNFESVDKQKNTLKLLAWAHIQSLANIKKAKEDDKTLVFTWHDQTKKEGYSQNAFHVDQAKQLVEIIIKMGNRYGIKVSKTIKKEKDLKIDDVTVKSYEDMNIEELLDNISFLESKLERDITIDVVNLLMNLYQKAVEYFSAFNDPRFEDFVDKLHFLLSREDVQAVLQSKEENDKTTTKPTTKRPSEEDDEEEKKEAPAHSREFVRDSPIRPIQNELSHKMHGSDEKSKGIIQEEQKKPENKNISQVPTKAEPVQAQSPKQEKVEEKPKTPQKVEAQASQPLPQSQKTPELKPQEKSPEKPKVEEIKPVEKPVAEKVPTPKKEETQPDTKPEIKEETKPEPKPEVKPEPKPEPKPETKPEEKIPEKPQEEEKKPEKAKKGKGKKGEKKEETQTEPKKEVKAPEEPKAKEPEQKLAEKSPEKLAEPEKTQSPKKEQAQSESKAEEKSPEKLKESEAKDAEKKSPEKSPQKSAEEAKVGTPQKVEEPVETQKLVEKSPQTDKQAQPENVNEKSSSDKAQIEEAKKEDVPENKEAAENKPTEEKNPTEIQNNSSTKPSEEFKKEENAPEIKPEEAKPENKSNEPEIKEEPKPEIKEEPKTDENPAKEEKTEEKDPEADSDKFDIE